MKDLGLLAYFPGLEVYKLDKGLFVNQHKYTQDLIALARLQNSILVNTPLKLNVKYRQDDGNLLCDPIVYKKLNWKSYLLDVLLQQTFLMVLIA